MLGTRGRRKIERDIDPHERVVPGRRSAHSASFARAGGCCCDCGSVPGEYGISPFRPTTEIATENIYRLGYYPGVPHEFQFLSTFGPNGLFLIGS